MGTFSCGCSSPIYRHLIYEFFIKIVIIMSISTNIYKLYVYDLMSPYVSLVNNSIDPIKLY